MSEHESDTVTDQQARTSRLRRPSDGRVVAGVAAGLAEHLRVDVTLVRVLFVLATPFNLLGVLVYGLLWLLVPSEGGAGAADAPGSGRSWAEGASWSDRGVGFWAGVGLIGVGALWLLPRGPLWILGPGSGQGVLLPLLLIGGGLALWLSEDRRAGALRNGSAAHASGAGDHDEGPGETGPVDHLDAATTAETPTVTGTAARPPTAPPPAPPAPPASADGPGGAPPPPTRERSPLVRVILGLALLVAGGLWLAGPAGVADVRAEGLLGAALLVVAAGLLVGSLWGRARLLILAGAPLSLLLVVALVAPVVLPTIPLTGTVGRGHVVVEDAADLRTEYEHVAGELRLDLRALDLDEDVATRVAVGAGEVEVLLPRDLPVEVDAAASVGELHVLDRRRAGVGPRVDVADGQGDAVLSLEVRVGAGELRVTRDPPDEGSSPSGLGRSERPSSLVTPEVRR